MNTGQNDKKKYNFFTLENGIKVVLVRSDNIEKSACSLVINTGHFDDPVNRPGLAHYIEHLLFTGNEKYPESHLLNKYVSKYAGHCNAWTSTEHSCFHFDITSKRFKKALDLFAHLFIEPLFSASAITKEQAAIHSEFKLKFKDDSRRIQQVHKETSNPAHPFHKFSVGNRHTLAEGESQSIEMELRQFWESEYLSQKMTLCVIHNTKLSSLRKLVRQRFGAIKGNSDFQPKKISVPLYRKEDLSQFIAIRPYRELHKLNITFALGDISVFYPTKMVTFISHIVGHESKGSLLERLKDKGLINSISAGGGISGSNFKDFNISFDLTEQGETAIDKILSTTFSYLHYLKNLITDNKKLNQLILLYNEQKKLSEVSLNYQEDISPLKLANNIALNMQHYPEEDYLIGDYRMDGFNAEQWRTIFQQFITENLRVILISQNIQAYQQAIWYKTPYSTVPLSQSQIQLLNNQPPLTNEFSLPSANPYLLEPIKIEEPDFEFSAPQRIVSQQGWNAWFKQDISFRVPKGNIHLSLDLPIGAKNIKSQAMMRLICDLFMDSVSEQHYQAEMAGLHYNVYAHNSGITFYTSGLSNNQEQLLLSLLSDIQGTFFCKSRFKQVKKQLILYWKSHGVGKPLSQLFGALSAHLLPTEFLAKNLAESLETVNFEQFQAFHQKAFKKIQANLLIYGNWNTSQALATNQKIQQQLSQSQFIFDRETQVKRIKDKMNLQFQITQKKADYASLLYVQINDDKDHLITDKAYSILLSQILSSFSFQYLRQVKQLGYQVGSGYMPINNQPGIVLYAQSHDHPSELLEKELNQCLFSFIEELTQLSEKRFRKHQQAVGKQYSEQASSLAQKSQQLWAAIIKKDNQFNQTEKITEAILGLNYIDAINWAKKHLNPNLHKAVLLSSVSDKPKARAP